MKHIIIIVLSILLLSSCHTSKRASSTGNGAYKTNTADRDGSSFSKAIIITEKTEMTGVSAEYDWLAKNYPGYHSLGQSLLIEGKTPYDMIKIRTSTGEEKKVYFDISNYFGK